MAFREMALRRLQISIMAHEDEINRALRLDLGKSASEAYMCETGMVLAEISYMLKHMRQFGKDQTVRTPLAQFASRSFRKPSPYGVTLIMSPWNYPFLLTMEPLVDALAAGNTAIVKPSAYSPFTSEIMEKIISECLPQKYVAVVNGGRKENQWLLKEKFDYIFFTGSQAVGKEVMAHAAKHLTPVTLELGGKSPCIVDEMKKQIWKQFGDDPLANANYGRIVNEKHFRRLLGLIDPTKVVAGGVCDSSLLQIAPTIMDHVTFEDAVMQEEIFGPILPVMTFHSLDAVISQINHREHPLALYMFTESKANADRVMTNCGFGGGCINDTVIHLATSEMGFGGFGESGMGSYHGKTGFDTFSHYKSIVDKKTWLDLPMRYQPYNKVFDFLIRLFMH